MTQTLKTIVLVVEDEPLIRSLATEVLEDEGYEVYAFANADDALDFLIRKDGSEIGALFTDVHMPGQMNGVELASVVAKNWPEIGILLTSGRYNLDDETPERVSFLPKPWTSDQMVEEVRHVIS